MADIDQEITLSSKINEPLKLSPFYYRPLCLMATVFAISNTAILLWGLNAIPPILLLWTIFSVFHFLRLKTIKQYLPWMLLISVCLSIGISGSHTLLRKNTVELAEHNTHFAELGADQSMLTVSRIRAEVISVYYCEQFGSSYYVKLLSIDEQKAYGYAVLNATEPLNAIPFDTVYCDGIIYEYENNITGTDKLYTLSKDIVAQIETDTAAVNTKGFQNSNERHTTSATVYQLSYTVFAKVVQRHSLCRSYSVTEMVLINLSSEIFPQRV